MSHHRDHSNKTDRLFTHHDDEQGNHTGRPLGVVDQRHLAEIRAYGFSSGASPIASVTLLDEDGEAFQFYIGAGDFATIARAFADAEWAALDEAKRQED